MECFSALSCSDVMLGTCDIGWGAASWAMSARALRRSCVAVLMAVVVPCGLNGEDRSLGGLVKACGRSAGLDDYVVLVAAPRVAREAGLSRADRSFAAFLCGSKQQRA